MWARKFDRCVVCLRDDRRHMAKGKCSYCYAREYQSDATRVARIKQQKHDSYIRLGGREASRHRREGKWFSGNRDAALERDGHRCVRCGSEEQLVVHHKDGNGRGASNPNNSLENLETLCRACHATEHGLLASWAKKYDACVGCGTIERKHNARGLCTRCYNFWRRGKLEVR